MSTTRTVHRFERAFSLSSLLLLMAVCAVFLALTSPVVRGVLSGDFDIPTPLIAAIIGGFALGVVGFFVGLFHYSKVNASLQGTLIGLVLGAMLGPLVALSPDSFAEVFFAAMINAALILGVAAGIRLMSDDWKKTSPGEKSIISVSGERTKPHPLDHDPSDGDE